MPKFVCKWEYLRSFFVALPIVFFIVLFCGNKAEAASFTHVHTDACYGNCTGYCSNHVLRNEYTESSFHCNNCGHFTTFHQSIWWDVCLNGLVASRDVSYYESCTVCGYVRKDEPVPAADGHYYTYRGLVCGKSDSTEIATLSLSAGSSAPTNTSVTINADVNATSSEFSLAAAPYDFGEGYTSSSSYEVTENGTYTVNVMASNGQVVSASVTVSCIDKDAPTVTSVSKSTEDWIEEGLTVTVSAEDSGSGLADAPFSFDGGAYTSDNSIFVTSNRTVTVSVMDRAGNVSTGSITVGNIGRDPAVIAAEKAEAERIAAEKAAAEKAAAEKAEAERIAAEKAAAEKAEAERVAAEKAAAEKAAAEKAQAASSKGSASTASSAVPGRSGSTSASKTDSALSSAGTSIKEFLSGIKKEAAAGLTKDTSGNDISGSDVSGNLFKNGGSSGGTLVDITDLTSKSKNNTETADVEIIESINDINRTSDSSDTEEYDLMEVSGNDITGDGPTLQMASMGPVSLATGMLLLFISLFISSFFNYIYVTENGHTRLLSLCTVRRDKENKRNMFVTVPKGKLKSGRHLIYFSLWNRFKYKKHNVLVKVKGEDRIIPTDEGNTFMN